MSFFVESEREGERERKRERELFLKAKVNAVIERTLIPSHVKWPCEESPEGEKGLE